MTGFFSRIVMDIGLLVLQLIGVIIWLGVLAPALILVIYLFSFLFMD